MTSTSLYDLSFTANDGEEVELSRFKGQPVLIVNTASKCGFTPQYAGLQRLYEQYKDRGLVVLGFPANNFLRQEPGTNAEIKQFCSTKYAVTFPMFAKVDVNGEKASPLYKHLKSTKKGLLGSEAIKWNFTKFLVAPDGTTVQRYAPNTEPAIKPPKCSLSPAFRKRP